MAPALALIVAHILLTLVIDKNEWSWARGISHFFFWCVQELEGYHTADASTITTAHTFGYFKKVSECDLVRVYQF